jgi:hypothetical protein
MNLNLFYAYCDFQIALTHGLGEFHLLWNLEEALDRWQGGTLPDASLVENNVNLRLPLKDSRRVAHIAPPAPPQWGSGSQDVMTVENNSYISIQNHPHESTPSSNAVWKWEIRESLDGIYDNYNVTFMLNLFQNVTYEVTN